jgi:hypothetical protein
LFVGMLFWRPDKKDNSEDLNVAISHHAYCKRCKTTLAEIFQGSGDYCLDCWQEKTCPNV